MKQITTIVFILFFNLVYSQNETVKDSLDLAELSLEQLLNIDVYSASRKVQRASDAPAIITVLNQNHIQSLGALTLIDILKFIPGIETSMGSDGFYRVAIRGSRKDGDILVLVNGMQINDFYSGKALYDLPIEFIERIEIIRGPGSALYGSNAMAGVINIFTKQENSIAIQAANNITLKANLNLHFEKNKTQFSFSAGALNTNGANALVDTDRVENKTWSLTHSDANFKTNRWVKEYYASSKLTIGDLHFQLYNLGRSQGSWVGPIYIAAPESNLNSNQITSSLYYDFRISNNVVITPKIYSNLIQHNFLIQETPNGQISDVSGNIFTNGKQSLEKYTAKTYGTEIDMYIKANDHFDILTGSVFENVQLNNYSLTRNYQIVGDVYKQNFGNYDSLPYLQDNKNRFIFAYFIQSNYHYKNLSITTGLRYDDYSDFGESFNPRLGINYKINTNFKIKALIGKAFRAPTFLELYDNTTIGNESGIKGNTTLTPEKINTYELAGEYISEIIIAKYNLYYNKNKDLIRVYDPHGEGSIGYYENIGAISTFGHEAEIIFKASKKINVFANYSHYISSFDWNKDKVKKFDIAFFEKQPNYAKTLNNSPTMRLNAGVNYNNKKFEMLVSANYGNLCYNNYRFYLEQDHFATIPFYLQGNINFIYSVINKFKVSIYCNNIGKKFSDPDESTNINAFGERGLIQPSATVLLNLKYSF